MVAHLIPNIELKSHYQKQYTVIIREKDNPDILAYDDLRDQHLVALYRDKKTIDIELSAQDLDQFCQRKSIEKVRKVEDILDRLK